MRVLNIPGGDMLSLFHAHRIIEAIYIGAELVCHYAPKIVQALTMVVTFSSATAALIPRLDSNGNPNVIHKFIDVLALNILNSAHNVGLATDIQEKSD